MLKLFLFAIAMAMVASVPLNQTFTQDITALELETFLETPEFENSTNTSVVLETLPKVEEFVRNELVNEIEIERDTEELFMLKNQTESIESELVELEREIESDRLNLEEKEIEIHEKVMESERLKKMEVEFEMEGQETVGKIVEIMNKTQNDLFMNETSNLTLRLELAREDLPVEERVKIIGTQFNETVREEVLAEEIKMIQLETKVKETENKTQEMDREILDKKAGVQHLLERVKMNERKFSELFDNLNLWQTRITNLTEKINNLMSERNPDKVVINQTYTTEERLTTTPLVPVEEPEFKNRTVRSILNKVNLYFQQKHSDVAEFVAKTYCKNDKEFQYYKSHPTDETKYVECNPWGEGMIKECPEGRVWDQFHEICSLEELYQIGLNMTRDFEKFEELEKTLLDMNCNNSQFHCLNGGRCENLEFGFECVCTEEFTGELCQHQVVAGSIFSEIMTNKFSLKKFTEEMAREEVDDSITEQEMKELREYVKPLTHKEAMGYLDLFEKNEYRYDTILEEVVESILEDIYPDAFAMNLFNASSHTLLEVVRTIPSLISYSRYSSDRYTEVFLKYQEVLVRLAENLNTTLPDLQNRAIVYTRLSSHIMNETGIMDALFKTVDRTSTEQIHQNLDQEFNKTKEESVKFNMELQSLRDYFKSYMKKNPQSIVMRLDEMTENQRVRDLITVFEKVSLSSSAVIESLFSYGFWTLNDMLAQQFLI